MLSYTLMQFVDAVMVAQVGPVEVAAQGNGGVWSWAIVVMLIGVLSLVNTFVSQAVGAGRPHEVARYAWAGVWLAAIAWAAVLLPVSFAMPWVFAQMGHGERVTELETSYAQVMMRGGLAVALGKAMSNFFFGIQRPRVITVAAIAGNAVNLVLNYVLIFGRDGLPSLGLPGVPGVEPMGVTGAAVATVIGTAAETAIPMAVFLGRRIDAEFGIRRAWRPDLDAIRDLVRLGMPAALQSGSELVTWAIFMTVLVGKFGDVALSGGRRSATCTCPSCPRTASASRSPASSASTSARGGTTWPPTGLASGSS
jgi:MATE family multidrug resistance protein